jgi:hypothetical protein
MIDSSFPLDTHVGYGLWLVATARIMNLTLITRDEKILEYGRSKFIQVLAV